MKRVKWIDAKGWKHVSLLRDTDDELKPERGIPLDPPPIESILEDAAMELNNELVDRGILTIEDVIQSQNGVSAAILNVFRRKILDAYRNRV